MSTAIVLVSCGGTEESEETSGYQESQNYIEEMEEDMATRETDVVEKSVPTEGSVRAMLIGKWQADDDESVVVEISRDRYYTIIDGRNNWDQEWDMSTELEITAENIDDNGPYLQVYLEDQEVFYATKISGLDENHFTATVEIGASGIGDIRSYTRIE